MDSLPSMADPLSLIRYREALEMLARELGGVRTLVRALHDEIESAQMAREELARRVDHLSRRVGLYAAEDGGPANEEKTTNTQETP